MQQNSHQITPRKHSHLPGSLYVEKKTFSSDERTFPPLPQELKTNNIKIKDFKLGSHENKDRVWNSSVSTNLNYHTRPSTAKVHRTSIVRISPINSPRQSLSSKHLLNSTLSSPSTSRRIGVQSARKGIRRSLTSQCDFSKLTLQSEISDEYGSIKDIPNTKDESITLDTISNIESSKNDTTKVENGNSINTIVPSLEITSVPASQSFLSTANPDIETIRNAIKLHIDPRQFQKRRHSTSYNSETKHKSFSTHCTSRVSIHDNALARAPLTPRQKAGCARTKSARVDRSTFPHSPLSKTPWDSSTLTEPTPGNDSTTPTSPLKLNIESRKSQMHIPDLTSQISTASQSDVAFNLLKRNSKSYQSPRARSNNIQTQKRMEKKEMRDSLKRNEVFTLRCKQILNTETEQVSNVETTTDIPLPNEVDTKENIKISMSNDDPIQNE